MSGPGDDPPPFDGEEPEGQEDESGPEPEELELTEGEAAVREGITAGLVFEPAGDDPALYPLAQWDGETHLWCAYRGRDDLGNADRLQARYEGRLAYVPRVGWHIWDGRKWDRESGDLGARVLAQQTVRAIRDEARALATKAADLKHRGEEERAKITGRMAERHTKWATDSSNSGRITAMLAEARPQLVEQFEDFDGRADLVTVHNGTLELGSRTVRLRRHDAADRITRGSVVAYDPDADAPRWREFLAECQPEAEVRDFLARWAGYCLTGHTYEQAFVMHVGRGSNGKSTFIQALSSVLGSYAATTPVSTILEKPAAGEGASPDLARLPGARMVIAAEPDKNRKLAEGQIKTMTGQDRMATRHLHQDYFEFQPQFKLNVVANTLPRVASQDFGLWRRVLVVPWHQRFIEEEVDKNLPRVLEEEAAGILNWMAQGARQWYALGLRPPASVRAAVADYRAENDSVGVWAEQCLERVPGHEERSQRLYSSYQAWAEDALRHTAAPATFGRALREVTLGGEDIRSRRSNGTVYLDVRLTDEAEAQMVDYQTRHAGRLA